MLLRRLPVTDYSLTRHCIGSLDLPEEHPTYERNLKVRIGNSVRQGARYAVRCCWVVFTRPSRRTAPGKEMKKSLGTISRRYMVKTSEYRLLRQTKRQKTIATFGNNQITSQEPTQDLRETKSLLLCASNGLKVNL